MAKQALENVKDTSRTLALAGPRLPYHPLLEERFGIDKSKWKALTEAIFPLATTTESVILALSYCRARGLDPFKRNVHIVPIWSKQQNAMVDTIWPGIGELRTTAFRTREYAGRGDTVWGPDVTEKIGNVSITYPEWAQVTLKRMVGGQPVEFSGPRVYWKETYANKSRTEAAPNEMWARRPRGQLDKCAEAAALRSAFPEEVGCDLIDDEVQNTLDPSQTLLIPKKQQSLTEFLSDAEAKEATDVGTDNDNGTELVTESRSDETIKTDGKLFGSADSYGEGH